jgi:hypothetical protein
MDFPTTWRILSQMSADNLALLPLAFSLLQKNGGTNVMIFAIFHR